jgi:hypothetical protein
MILLTCSYDMFIWFCPWLNTTDAGDVLLPPDLAIDIGSRFSIHTSSFFISSIGYYSRTKYMGYLNIALERDWSCSLWLLKCAHVSLSAPHQTHSCAVPWAIGRATDQSIGLGSARNPIRFPRFRLENITLARAFRTSGHCCRIVTSALRCAISACLVRHPSFILFPVAIR